MPGIQLYSCTVLCIQQYSLAHTHCNLQYASPKMYVEHAYCIRWGRSLRSTNTHSRSEWTRENLEVFFLQQQKFCTQFSVCSATRLEWRLKFVWFFDLEKVLFFSLLSPNQHKKPKRSNSSTVWLLNLIFFYKNNFSYFFFIGNFSFNLFFVV